MIKLAVFLGNPGKNYEKTRHNFPQQLITGLPAFQNLLWKEKFHGRIAEYTSGSGFQASQTMKKCLFLLPQTFMNVSGKSVAAAVKFYKLKPEEILVIHDDLELPFGTCKTRLGGGLGGHNGLRSIKTSIGTPGFYRLRMGIGRPDRGDVSSWVLGRFAPDEEALIPGILEKTEKILTDLLTDTAL